MTPHNIQNTTISKDDFCLESRDNVKTIRTPIEELILGTLILNT